MKLITIGLPVYNALPWLRESLSSLLNQSDGDFQILAIDDGSTDASLAYLRSVRDPRLRVVTQSNQGVTATLNRMLKEVNTPWLLRHDADDIALPNRVAVIRAAIREFPQSGMFYTNARYIQDCNTLGSFRTSKASPSKLRELTLAGHLLAICHPTVALNVQKTLSVGGYRFNLHVEDIDLWWRMALHHTIQFLPEVTIHFRHNASSVSSNNLELQSLNTLYIQYLLLSELQGASPASYEEVALVLSTLLNRSKLRFRERMRMANIALGSRKRASAARHLFAAALSSPTHFANRIRYEFAAQDVAVAGEDPALFSTIAESLWTARLSDQNPRESAATALSA
jgi:glycosyltransferase involved in cell wall biosynthesis